MIFRLVFPALVGAAAAGGGSEGLSPGEAITPVMPAALSLRRGRMKSASGKELRHGGFPFGEAQDENQFLPCGRFAEAAAPPSAGRPL